MAIEVSWTVEQDEEVVPARVGVDPTVILQRRRLARGTQVDMAHLGDAAEALERFSVGDALRDRGVTVQRTATLARVFDLMCACQEEALVVVDSQRRPIGVIDQECLQLLPDDTVAGLRASDVMVVLVVVIRDRANAFNAAQIMRDSQVEKLVVVDDLGLFEGILSAEDLLDLAF